MGMLELESLIEQEGFGDDGVTDLLFVNYKEIDDAGHNWNMLNPEMRSTLEYADDVLGSLRRFLEHPTPGPLAQDRPVAGSLPMPRPRPGPRGRRRVRARPRSGARVGR